MMKIVIAHNGKIPVFGYGGIERVIWSLGKELVKLGHKIVFLVPEGSFCPFAEVKIYDPRISLNKQIPENSDLVHFHFQPKESIEFRHLITIHGNLPPETVFSLNTSFLSKNHAARFGADAYVYNGLDWDEYGIPDFNTKREYVHFLGKAAWKVKNVKAAIHIAQANQTQIKIIGGTRINFKMGFRFTLTRMARFYGMIGGQQKNDILNGSKALINPVLWHEPFGLSNIESLYFGCPVLGTKYGSLPEIVCSEVGFLSNSMEELILEFKNLDFFDRKKCHDYAVDNFNSQKMAKNYLKLYEKILNGEQINQATPEFKWDKNQLV